MLVVAVAVLRGGRVLAAQRSYPPELVGQWEFPGGKAHDGEDERDAAVRECAEELGVVVHVDGRLGADARTAAGHSLHLWSATLVSGEPEPREHRALRWLSPDELGGVPWIAADLPLVAAVDARLRGAASGYVEARPTSEVPP
ncbi:MAG: 8-oxo-dGTP diphosphatase [Frankiaceae bacterium]|jgi:8-oxo-dGTP diphosphatase|nr:8-oxo-dGTP diphosphatase [Frankiaceae bacterium]